MHELSDEIEALIYQRNVMSDYSTLLLHVPVEFIEGNMFQNLKV